MFRVGQKVVCIKRGEWNGVQNVPNRPVRGGVYTVREFADDGGLLFDEIVNPPIDCIEGFLEPAWMPIRFRPIIERKTDISVFTEMLTKTGVDA